MLMSDWGKRKRKKDFDEIAFAVVI